MKSIWQTPGADTFISAPKDTPDEVIDILAEGVKKACENPEFIEKFEETASAEVKYCGPEETTKILKEQKDLMIQLGWGTGYQG